MDRPQRYHFRQDVKILPFSEAEHEVCLTGLRKIMADQNLDACILTSMHNIAYYSVFLYCAFGCPCGEDSIEHYAVRPILKRFADDLFTTFRFRVDLTKQIHLLETQ